ncbi:MAG TPA: PAS domain S-box protein, partial [Stenomitos sp.]
MIDLAGITVQDQIYESANSLVYRAIKQPEQTSVILKFLKEDYPTPAELIRYQQEYEITRSLNLEGVIKVYSLQGYYRTLVLIVEDFGGESLHRLSKLSGEAYFPMPLTEFLKLAIKITQILAGIHGANVIHKDINPGNIVLNPKTGQVKIIDFGISTRLIYTNPTLSHPNVLEGTLAYMSPEQTGRMNRCLDYRTDFYSLGVTFYELLTGQLPFPTTDVLELVHCHIAKQPVPPHLIGTEEGERGRETPSNFNSYKCPKAVSNIVMKLLAKTAEERYQSAWGIIADLEECLLQLETTGTDLIQEFELGVYDSYDKFIIPQKLYGREAEVATLLAAFERVVGTDELLVSSSQLKETIQDEKLTPQTLHHEMMLVVGYSGIGKSALVAEIHKPITRQKGYFISGKFDPFGRNIPYSALVTALTQLVRQLLTENEADLNQWRAKLLSALGSNGQVIIDVIPEIELIIGKQPTIPELGVTESQNRFNLVFQNFIRVFCNREHPLVIFLDDLQWADTATLKWLQLMMTDTYTQYLFFIGAYRDNEVSLIHPLIITLEGLRQAGAIIHQITLAPLGLTHVSQLIADTLHSDIETVKPLAELVLQKTAGNPFFVKEFLKTLYIENLITFISERVRTRNTTPRPNPQWQWDIATIEAMDITDNVVELMIGSLNKLPESTQEMLRFAACIGTNFDLKTLSIISGKSHPKVFQDLGEAIQQGFILPVSELDEQLLIQNYKFRHDRIQQAAYTWMSDRDKKALHLQIGRLLLQNTLPDSLSERIFAIVDHLNQGIELVSCQTERYKIAQLNLIAGKKAKAATAYDSALSYFNQGRERLAADSWESEYDLTIALYIESVEAEYLNADYEQVEALSHIVLQRANTILEKIKVYVIKILRCSAQNQMQAAIEMGLEVLELLGVSLSESKPQILSIEELYNLPTITEPYKEAALRILIILFAPIYIANPVLLPSLSFTLVQLCINNGNSPLAAYAYGLYGLVLCGILGDIEAGYQFGQLALRILDKFDAKEIECRVYNNFYSFIIHWQKAARTSLNPLIDTIQIGLETGEIEFTCYASTNYCQNLYLIGEPLESVASELQKYIKLIQNLKQAYQVNYCQIWQQLVSSLTEGRKYLSINNNKLERLSERISENDWSLLYHFYLANTILNYFFKNSSQSVINAKNLEKCEAGIVGLFPSTQSPFYYSLALLAQYPGVTAREQIEYLEKVEANQQRLKAWADHAPMNYLHKYELVEAEKARVLGQNWEASEWYERAIQGAKENQYLHEEALAYELAAEFYLAQGRSKIAETYLTEAYYGYVRWQANSKVQDLEERYPQFFRQKLSSLPTSPRTSSRTSTQISSALDLKSILKASQVLSGELSLENLLVKMMKIVIENAGAQNGFLISSSLAKPGNSNGQWRIEASGTVASDEVQVLQSIPIETVSGSSETPLVSNAIANYVIRTQTTLVLQDAAHDGDFTRDPYILKQQPKSILCMPLIHQGKLVGILYLENNLTTGAFTPERLEVLHLLSSQAAISIENAQLYAQLRESESKWTQLLEAVPVGVSLHTADGKVFYINQTGQSLIHHSINPEASPNQIAQAYNLYRAETDELYPTEQLPALRALKGEHVIVDDIEVRYEGKIIPFELRSTPVFDNKGNIIYAVSAFQDITDRKQAEKLLTDYNRTLEAEVTQRTAELTQINQQLEREIAERKQAEDALRASEARFRALAQVSPDIITLSNPDCGVFYQSPAVERILGYSPNEFVGEQPLQALHPEDRPNLDATIARQLANPRVPVTTEYRLRHKDGTWVWLEGVATNWLDEPAIGAFMIISRDIRDRKRTQDALQQSETRYRAIVEDQTELVSRFLPDGTLTFINEAYCRYFGVKREELIGKHYAPVVLAEDLEYIEQQVKSISRDNPVVVIENRVVVGGEVRWTQWINRALFNQQGDLVELQSIGRDISDKKQVELALKQSERRYRQIVQTADEGIWVIDSEANTTFANPKMAQMLGYSIEQMLGMSIFAFMDEEWQVLAQQNLERRRQDIAGKYDFKLRRKDGSELWVMVASNPIFDESGQYTGALKMMTDITQRKYAEDALRRYERIVSMTTDAIALTDRNYRYQVLNQTYTTWRKKPKEDIIGHSASEILGADVFENFVKPLVDRCLAGETIHYQAWFDYGPEERRFLSVTYVPYVEPDQTISGVVASLRDLTELKQAEEELQRSEERLQLAFEGSGDGFWDWNIPTGEIYWSPQWFKMLGYETDEFRGEYRNWEQVVHPDDLPWITEKLNAHLKNPSVLYNCDYRLRTKSGRWKWVSTYGRVVARDERGTPTRMAGIHRDINDKKRAEEALRESEQRYRQMIETSEEGIWIIDMQGKTLFANPKMAQMLGCTVEELLGLTMFDFMDKEGIAIANWNLERRRQGIQEKHDFKFRRKDGSELWVIISTTPILDESGQATGALGMLTDITQRKRAEEALEQSERLFRILAEISPVGIFRSNASGQTIYANDRACQIVGASLGEVLGWGWGSYIHPADTNRVQQTWQYSMTHQVPWQDEYRLLNREGKVVWVLAQAEVERDETGKVVGYVGTLTDISDRKAIEMALREQKELLQTIFDHIPIMLCFYNAEAQVELVNPAMENTIGWSLEEFRQIDVMAECYPDPDYRAALFEFMMRADGTWRDVQLRTRNGTLLETCWANVRLPNGWQVGIGQDITERQRAEQALRESEQRFREIAETISQFFFVRSATSGEYLYANPAYEQIWGRTCESLYQNPLSWIETIHPDDRPLVLNSLQAQFQGKPVKREYRIIRADGQVRWIVADISIVFDEAGQPLRFVGLAEDITERKQAEEALRE